MVIMIVFLWRQERYASNEKNIKAMLRVCWEFIMSEVCYLEKFCESFLQEKLSIMM